MQVVLGLGGNVGDVAAAFAEARSRLEAWSRVVAASRLFRTAPVGTLEQPDFLNAALRLELACDLGELVARCQELESEAGRDRSTEARWGPRTLDLDLLLVRDAVHRGPRLELPHPRLHERAFALVPAAEVAPGWLHPLLGQTLDRLAERAAERDRCAVSPAPTHILWRAWPAS
jgi:2-amino-4-hydroxy-6-hydroxymethyldihydropteridine diphosphokinase